MQPQGHVQVLLNLIDFQMNPQLSLDVPRVCIEKGEAGGHVLIEDGIEEKVVDQLRQR
jgi:gamma-glutamyltranspeptidase/glutathione hydrolase